MIRSKELSKTFAEKGEIVSSLLVNSLQNLTTAETEPKVLADCGVPPKQTVVMPDAGLTSPPCSLIQRLTRSLM